MTSKDLIQEFASKLEVTPEQLAADIHALCAWIQEQGNRGYTELQLKDAGLPIYFLDADKALWDGMLFHAIPERKKDYSGWGVKRQPMLRDILAWEVNWLHTFQHLEIELVGLVKAKIDDARNPAINEGDWVEYEGVVYRVHSVRSSGMYLLESIYDGFGAIIVPRLQLTKVDAPRRRRDSFSGGSFENFSTFEIAYRAACAVVLADWYTNARFHETYSRVYPHREAVTVWREQYRILRNELVYRTHAASPEKGSKKKTKEAAEDWAKAAEYLEKGTLYFFSREFLKAVTESPEYPDLSIDPDHLPKALPERIPVAWKSDREVLSDVLKWLDKDIDPASFEYEDREKFIDVARRWIATARGEGVR